MPTRTSASGRDADTANRINVTLSRALWVNGLTPSDKERLEDEFRAEAPKQLAILSFAGLDTHDVLLYSLLAHELGHFIDYSYHKPRHLSDEIKQSSNITKDEIREVLNRTYKPEDVEDNLPAIQSMLSNRIQICLREILADLLATRMMGLSFFISQAEFLKTLVEWPEEPILDSGYPGLKFRLKVIFDHLTSQTNTKAPNTLQNFLKEHRENNAAVVDSLDEYLNLWRKRFDATETPLPFDVDHQLSELAEKAVRRSIPQLEVIAAELIPPDRVAYLRPNFFERIGLLRSQLPPSCDGEAHDSFAEIMSASWAYQILFGEKKEASLETHQERFEEYSRTCRLVLKAIELIPSGAIALQEENLTKAKIDIGEWRSKPGVLGRTSIQERMFSLSMDHPAYLGIIPRARKDIQHASLDIHLGNWFVHARRTKLRTVRVGDEIQKKLLMTLGREETFVPNGKTFLIHPGDFILGATLEFVALPNDLMAFVEGRSGLGRLGLFVATATPVAPGFHGVVVLELANTGTVPLELEPEMSIGQLVFQVMTEPLAEGYAGKFQCQIKP